MAEKKKESIAERVFGWLDNYPYLQWALKQDLINHSSLSRRMQEDLQVKNFDAVLVAVRRYQDSLAKKAVPETKIMDVIRKSRLDIRTGMNVYVVKKVDFEILKKLGNFHIVWGDYVTLITDAQLPELPIVKKYENLVEVRVKSPIEIESTPGVVATLYEKIGELGVNITETYSCYTDTIFVIDKRDLTRLLGLFEKIGMA